MSDRIKRVITEKVLAPMATRCTTQSIVVCADEELRAMTRCFTSLDGLDFANNGEGRALLYSMRETAQTGHGLYFSAERSVGIRFTRDAMLGMRWREVEFDSRTTAAASQVCRMWAEALRVTDGAEQGESVIEAADERYRVIQEASEQIRAFLFANAPTDRGDAVPQQRGRVSSSDVLRCLMLSKVGWVSSERAIAWSDQVARIATAAAVDRDFALSWLRDLSARYGASAHPNRTRRDRANSLPESSAVAVALVEAWMRESERKTA